MPLIYLLDQDIDCFSTGVIFRLFLRNQDQEVVNSTRTTDLRAFFLKKTEDNIWRLSIQDLVANIHDPVVSICKIPMGEVGQVF